MEPIPLDDPIKYLRIVRYMLWDKVDSRSKNEICIHC